MSGNERRNRKFFRWCWNDCRVDALAMYSGSEFQMEEAAAGRAHRLSRLLACVAMVGKDVAVSVFVCAFVELRLPPSRRCWISRRRTPCHRYSRHSVCVPCARGLVSVSAAATANCFRFRSLRSPSFPAEAVVVGACAPWPVDVAARRRCACTERTWWGTERRTTWTPNRPRNLISINQSSLLFQ